MTAALLGPDEMVKPQPERTPLDADLGIILCGAPTAQMAAQFITAIGKHRHWERESKGQVPHDQTAVRSSSSSKRLESERLTP